MADKLFDCADSFSDLTNYEYHIKLYSHGKILDTTIQFDLCNFMHLSGLEKLNDLPLIDTSNSKDLFFNILNNSINYNYICNSKHWNNIFNDVKKNNVAYKLEDRIQSLNELQTLLRNSTIQAFEWNNGTDNTKRPFSSDIAADFMLKFDNPNKKTKSENVFAFFRLDKNTTEKAYGVSQFPTDRTYNCDGIRRVPEATIISLVEHDKINNIDKTIMELSPKEQEKLIIKSANYEEHTTINNDIKQIKNKRKKYAASNSPANQRAYEKKLSVFSNKNIYKNIDMLKDVINSLQAQKQDPNNSDVKDLIEKEIEFVQAEISEREKGHDKETALKSFSITQNTQNADGTLAVKPIMTVEIPKNVVNAKQNIERTSHRINGSIASVFIDISDFIKNTANSIKKALSPQKEPSKKNKTVSKTPHNKTNSFKAVQKKETVKKPVEKVPTEKAQEPEQKKSRFCKADLKSEKYAPRSQKKDRSVNRNRNDLEH